MKESDPVFFATPALLRKWFRENHETATEIWIGFHKKATGTKSITWPEAVDEALCVGWIDGIRKRIDDEAYKIRFTRRKPASIWSAVNIKRVEELTAEGRMKPAGTAAFERRRENRSGIYSYEQRSAEFDDSYADHFKKNKAAWEFFNTLSAYKRKLSVWWVVSAKKEETRMARLNKLIEISARKEVIDQLQGTKKK